jgi:hypothetical protein
MDLGMSRLSRMTKVGKRCRKVVELFKERTMTAIKNKQKQASAFRKVVQLFKEKTMTAIKKESSSSGGEQKRYREV